MMVTRFRPGSAGQHEAFEAEFIRLSSLLADMARISRGFEIEELARNAPLLDRWAEGIRPAPCLVGLSTGHPILLGEDRRIATSDLLLMSDDGQSARTRSRWYRLGRPAGHGRQDA